MKKAEREALRKRVDAALAKTYGWCELADVDVVFDLVAREVDRERRRTNAEQRRHEAAMEALAARPQPPDALESPQPAVWGEKGWL